MRPFDLMRAQHASLRKEFLSGVIEAAYVFTRSSQATYFLQTGLQANAISGATRFDWDPVALTPNGLFMEEGRTNLCLRSAAFGNATWVKTTCTGTTSDQTGIDGTASYGSMTASAGNGTCLQTITVVNATTYQFSIYLKRLTGSGTIQITTDNGTTWNTVAVSATLTRFTQQQVASGTSMVIGVRIVTNADAVIAGDVCLEAGAFVTSPQSTGASSAVRNRDQLAYTIPSDAQEGFNQNDMAFGVEVKVSNFVTNMRLASISDGTANNGLYLTTDSSGNLTMSYIVNGTTKNVTGPLLVAGTVYKIAASAGTNGILLGVNGTPFMAASAGVLAPIAVLNTLNPGIDSNGGVMWLRGLRLWRHGLSKDRIAATTV